MTHIVFSEADRNVLAQAMAADEQMAGDVVCFTDDLSIGPLADESSPESVRAEWWAQVSGSDVQAASESDRATLNKIIEELNADEAATVWIWAAQNPRDVCGYYNLLAHLKPFSGRALILYLNNLPFINDKGNIFYPDRLSDIPGKEFIKAKKLAREITASEFETDPDEWTKLVQEARGVRILEGGKKLAQGDYDQFDGELKKFVTKDFQKAGGIIRRFMEKNRQPVSEAFLLWRLRTMAATGLLELPAETKNKKETELRLPQPTVAA